MPVRLPAKRERRLALVVVDAQLKFFADGDLDVAECRRLHAPAVSEAVDLFRAAGRPVVFVVYDGYTHGSTERDPALERLIPEAHALDSDPRVHKYHMNSFRNTELADVVRDLGCDSVLLAGAFTQYCVMATYFGAIDQGIQPFLLEGGTIATRESALEAAETICRTYSMDEVRENLATARVAPRGNADDWEDRNAVRKLPGEG